MRKTKVKVVFFDLDRTLWDFEKNANETLVELFDEFNFSNYTNHTSQDFVDSFRKHTHSLWQEYEQGIIDKQTLRERRFQLAMEDIAVPLHNRPVLMWNHFLERCPYRTNLLPGTHEVLNSLSQHYPLYIITNGFTEIQRTKLENTGLLGFFNDVIISEEVGCKKPEKAIFELALKRAGIVNSQDALMIGDSLEHDVLGAMNAGLQAVWMNSQLLNKHPDFAEIKTISSLHELKHILL